jgi:hypothetical protein
MTSTCLPSRDTYGLMVCHDPVSLSTKVRSNPETQD